MPNNSKKDTNQLVDCLSQPGPIADYIRTPIVQVNEITIQLQATASRPELTALTGCSIIQRTFSTQACSRTKMAKHHPRNYE